MQFELNTLRTSSANNNNNNNLSQEYYITPCIDTRIIGSSLVDDLSDYGIPLLRSDRINQRIQNYKKKVILDRKRDEGEVVAGEGWRYPRQGPKALVHLPEEIEVNYHQSIVNLAY